MKTLNEVLKVNWNTERTVPEQHNALMEYLCRIQNHT